MIFTSGATDAIKVIAQSFDWDDHKQVSQEKEEGVNSCCNSQENSKGQEDHLTSQNVSDSEIRNGVKKRQDQLWNGNVKESWKERNNCGCFRLDCLEGHKQLWNGNVSESGKEKDDIGQLKRESFPPHSHCLNQHEEKTNNEERDTYPGAFVYTRENHTSVLGIRVLAHQAGCDVYSVPTEEIGKILQDKPHKPHKPVGKAREGDSVHESSRNEADNSPALVNNSQHTDNFTQNEIPRSEHCEVGSKRRRNCLFAFSGQCNFSGAKFPLTWIDKVQAGALSSILDSSPINNTSGGGKGLIAGTFI